MRFLPILTALLLASFALAGCFGETDDEPDCEEHAHDSIEGDHAHDECPEPSTSETNEPGTNETTEPEVNATPNEPPVMVLVTYDAGGANVTNFVNVTDSMVFDAKLSLDPDGELVQAAVIVTDSNQTRFASLLEDGVFSTASFVMDRPGVVNVTLNGIDDRGATSALQTQVFVNHPQHPATFQFNGATITGATACEGPTGDAIADAAAWKAMSFDVRAGATFIEAQVDAEGTGADLVWAICDPDGNAISAEFGAGEMGRTDPGVNFTASLDYYISVASHAPRTTAVPFVYVHYEPEAATASAEAPEE